MTKLSIIPLLYDPEEPEILGNFIECYGKPELELRDLCERTKELFVKHFREVGLPQPREMQRYSDNPKQFPFDREFKMDVYAAIAMRYLEQLEELDALRKAS